MSLAVLADHMASKGRNGDTMLVHMAPEEVRGLHALAAAHGGELTINPETGLPEANFLKRLLPTIIGAALAATGVGAPMAAMLVGGFEAVRTGDLTKGLMAGLGAYGGAGIGSALSGAGSAAIGSQAVADAGRQAVLERAAQMGGEQGLSTIALTEPAAREAIAKEAISKAGAFDKFSAGLKGLTEAEGRNLFMKEIGGVPGALRTAYMGAGPLLAAEATQKNAPVTVTQMPVYQNATFDPISQTYIYGPPTRGASGGLMGMATGGVAFESGTTPSYQRTSMSPGMLDFADRSEPVVRMADGGFTDERVAQALRESMGQGFSLEQSLGGAASKFGISQDQLARAQTLLNAPATTAATAASPFKASREQVLAAYKANPLAELNPNEEAINYWMGQGLGSFNDVVKSARAENPGLATFIDATRNPAATTAATTPFATAETTLPNYLGLNAVAAGAPTTFVSSTAPTGYDYAAAQLKSQRERDINEIYNRVLGRQAEQSGLDYWANSNLSLGQIEQQIKNIAGDIGVKVDPTQLATPTAAQLAAQKSILADPQAAALAAARSGIAAGMTDQQIADMVNMQYGKSFSAQNVADFMRANNLTRPTRPTVPIIPVSPTPDLFPGTTPGVISTGEPFTPTVQTMDQVRSTYEQGGGATKMPVITDIKPTDRTYTYNQAFDLLQGYLKANPNALYGDVVAFARSRGIPDMQARAAYNEFRFSGLTGGSKQAYDYLMGRGAYPTKPFTPTGEIMRPYAESVLGAPADIKTKRFIFDPATQKYVENPAFVPRKSSAQREKEAGIAPDGSSSSSSSSGTGAKVQWSNQATGELINSTEDDPRYKNDPAWSIVQRYARGGLPSLAALGGAAGGGQFDLGSYSDGGRLLRGPGDGVSDSIPATIGGKRPARLADGEFVVPARIVSELGNGSTEAGARKLYAMMDRVQAARRKSIGKGKVAKNSRADKYLPA